MKVATIVAVCLAVIAATAAGGALAQGTPPGFEHKPLPIYPAKPTDCYVLLKTQWPYVRGGDYPVCRTVLENLNKFCGERPLYDLRRIHPTTELLGEPSWEPMEANTNPELVKQTIMANSLPKVRESQWQALAPRIARATASGDLHLFRASISADLRGGQQVVYRVDNAGMPDKAGYNQSSLMIAASGRTVPEPVFTLAGELRGDLWSFRGHWFVVRFDPIEQRFHVNEMIRPRAGSEAPIVAAPRCTLQHIGDRQGAN